MVDDKTKLEIEVVKELRETIKFNYNLKFIGYIQILAIFTIICLAILDYGFRSNNLNIVAGIAFSWMEGILIIWFLKEKNDFKPLQEQFFEAGKILGHKYSSDISPPKIREEIGMEKIRSDEIEIRWEGKKYLFWALTIILVILLINYIFLRIYGFI